jgi:hypothetical protein
MNPTNKIVFTKEKFGTELYLKVSQQLQLLIEAGNLCSVYNKDNNPNVIIIEHVPSNPALLHPYPYYLYPDEASYVSIYIAKKNLKQYEEEIVELSESIEESEDKNGSFGIFDFDDGNKNGGNLN